MSSRSRTRSCAAASRGSADLPRGAVVAGFRVESLIGRGSQAAVYEATQLNLGRAVALKVFDDPALADRVRRLRWPEHPGAISLFGTGDSEHGPWLAMRLVRGGTLAERDAPLDDVAGALAAAHAAGVVHGSVSARNVLVERGRAALSDFGLVEGTVAGDVAALEQLMRRHRVRRARRRRLGWAAVVAATVVVVGAAVAAGGDDESAPGVPAGTRTVGSDLAPGDVESVDCEGRTAGGASRACTISQRTLAGRPVVVPADGTITSWAVRGASGTIALQVARGRERLIEVERSADAVVDGPGLFVARARIPVAAGDRVGLLVTPGATVGVRSDGPPATVERWFGPLVEPARPPERGVGTGLDRELLLRVDVRPGEAAPRVAALRGARAAAAPAGRTIVSREVGPRTAEVVVVGGAVAVDLREGARRVARAPLLEADRRGMLIALTVRGDELRIVWRNPDGRQFAREVSVPRRRG